MKTNLFLAAMAMTCALVFGCSKCKDDNCLKDVSITSVLPNSNPVGYEVLLKTSGFSDTAKVVFGSVEASWRPGGATGEIIARVPAGLSGNVEISVEDGDCIARSAGFTVLGAYPGNIQPSLPDIIIPVPTTNLPIGGFENSWANATDTITKSSGIHLVGDFKGANEATLDGSYEFSTNPKLNGVVTGTITKSSNKVVLQIDRADGKENFEGQFIEIPSFVSYGSEYAILLVNKETGRQLVIFYKN